MAHFIGIDLGTTFSAVSILDETGSPRIVHNLDGQNITPSNIAKIDGKYCVGEVARRTWTRDSYSGEAVGRFKRHMGTDKTYRIGDKEFTPTELSALVLKKLAQDVVTQVGEIGEAVVTIPANFGNEAREATMSAAKQAGLNVRFIINEPTAAALYYAYKEKGGVHGVYAVYDLGGGTFDISIIRVDGHNVEVLATNGIQKLGGDDFDKALRKIAFDKYQQATEEVADARDCELGAIENDKKDLSQIQKISVKINLELIEVLREEFNEEISSLVAQTEMVCESTMEEADIMPSDIQGVLLAGGSTRIPIVRESIKRVFQQEPIATANVDEVVSMGAVLYAAYKGDQSQLSALQKKFIQQIDLSEKTSKFFGTIAMTKDRERESEKSVNSILIRKGEAIPCSVTESYQTRHDDQRAIICRVTESSLDDTDLNSAKIMWEEQMDLPPGRPAGQKIQITFSYDESQVMHCVFLDVASGNKREVRLSTTQSENNDSEHDVENITVE